MDNPLDMLKGKIQEIEQTVKTRVKIELLEEGAVTALSRLKTLNPGRAVTYQAAIDQLEN